MTWSGYTPQQLRVLFRAEQPEDFVTKFPPPERQLLSSESGHRPVSKDLEARRAGRHFSPIVGSPWSIEFRRLMSDEGAMLRLRDWFPCRWALVKLEPYQTWGLRRREERAFQIRCMTMYLLGNYEPRDIAAILGAKSEIVWRAIHQSSRMMSDLIGPLGEHLRALNPDRFNDGLKPEAVA